MMQGTSIVKNNYPCFGWWISYNNNIIYIIKNKIESKNHCEIGSSIISGLKFLKNRIQMNV